MKKIIAIVLTVAVLFLCNSVGERVKNPRENPLTENLIYENLPQTDEFAVEELLEENEDMFENNSSKTTEATVYRTKTGTKYHRYGCRYLYKSCIEIDIGEAHSRGLEACSRCEP
ncbi:MAG: hypothetical protein E7414_01425 [Ruminococcaceae bacterium]|nr:hypothetical protein [Oscillospiraceae bacterium]